MHFTITASDGRTKTIHVLDKRKADRWVQLELMETLPPFLESEYEKLNSYVMNNSPFIHQESMLFQMLDDILSGRESRRVPISKK